MRKYVLLAGAAVVASLVGAQKATAQTKWSGPYIGATAGVSVLMSDNDLSQAWDDEGYGDNMHLQKHSSGFAGGVYAGYNFQIGNAVYGVEADFSGHTNSNSTSIQHVDSGDIGVLNHKMSAMGSVRARAGIDLGGTLAYLTGGFAYANIRNSYTVADKSINFNRGSWRAGWIAGAGLEHLINQNISLRAEVLYAGFGSDNISDRGGYFDSDIKMKVDNDVVIGRAGVAFKF